MMEAPVTISDNIRQTVILVESNAELGDLTFRIVPDDSLYTADADSQRIGRLTIDGNDYTLFATARRHTQPLSSIGKLSNREIQIAHLVMSGACNKRIAQQLRISPYTVASYLKRIFCKLDCRTRAEMVAMIADYFR